MPYRVARVSGDPRRLVIHPERGAGAPLLVGLGVASTAVGGTLAMMNPLAGIVVAGAAALFAGWVGTEAVITRVELVRDEREGRIELRWFGIGRKRELFISLDDPRDVVVETSSAGTERLVLRLNSEERVPLTPFSSGSATELARELTAHVQGT